MKVIRFLTGILLIPSLAFAQASGTPRQLRVMTDATDALVATSAVQTLPLSQSILFSNIRLRTDANGYLVVTYTGGTTSAAITYLFNNIQTTSTDAITLANETATTAGIPVQQSPRIRYRAHVWNTTAVAADNTSDMWWENKPLSGTNPEGQLRLGASDNGGATYYPFTVGAFPTTNTYSSVWFGVTSPSVSNFSFLGKNDNSQTMLNASGAGATIELRIGNITHFSMGSLGVTVNGPANTAPTIPFLVTNAANNANLFSISDAGVVSALAGSIVTAANSTTVAPLTITNGTLLSSATANTVENDGVSLYNTVDTTNGRRASDAWNFFRLTGSGSGITTIADFFGTNDGIPLVANGVYEIEWHCYFSQASAGGTATWTIVTATTNLANMNAEYIGSPIGGIGTVGTPQTAGIVVTNSSSSALPVTGTEAVATHYFVIHAIVTAGNGASNTRLRLTMSAGTATPLINSYFKVRRLPAGNTGAFVS